MSRLCNIDVDLISILEEPYKPCNGKDLVYKSLANSRVEISREAVIKAEKGLLEVLVMCAEEVDFEGDVISLDDVEKAAHAFLKKGSTKRIDKDHNLIVNDKVYVAESWVDYETKSWRAVLDISADPMMMSKAKAGKLTGVSIYGDADRLEKGAKGAKWWPFGVKKQKNVAEGNSAEEGVVSLTRDDVKAVVLEILTKKEEVAKSKNEQEAVIKGIVDPLLDVVKTLGEKVEKLAKSRQTDESSTEKVSYEDLLCDPVKLVKYKKEQPALYERLKDDYLRKED